MLRSRAAGSGGGPTHAVAVGLLVQIGDPRFYQLWVDGRVHCQFLRFVSQRLFVRSFEGAPRGDLLPHWLGLGWAPFTEAVVCSSATVWARSPLARPWRSRWGGTCSGERPTR